MKRMVFRGIHELSQGHTIIQWQSKDSHTCFIPKSLFGIAKFIFPLAKLSFISLGFQEGNTKFRRCIFKFSQSATNFPQERHKSSDVCSVIYRVNIFFIRNFPRYGREVYGWENRLFLWKGSNSFPARLQDNQS